MHIVRREYYYKELDDVCSAYSCVFILTSWRPITLPVKAKLDNTKLSKISRTMIVTKIIISATSRVSRVEATGSLRCILRVLGYVAYGLPSIIGACNCVVLIFKFFILFKNREKNISLFSVYPI